MHPLARTRTRQVWLWCAAALLLLSAGCSLTSAYRYADWLIVWKLDHYFGLSWSQRQNVAQRLTPILSRHRQEALPQYESVARQARQRLERGLTGEDVDWAYDTYDRLRADLFERLVQDGGQFLASLEARQVRAFEAALRKDDEKSARLAQMPAAERAKERAQAAIKWLEEWVGSLTKAQAEQIREWSRMLPDTQPALVAYHQQRRHELLTLAKERRTPEITAKELHDLLVEQDRTAPAAYLEAVQKMRSAIKPMVLALDRSLTPEQRRYALTKLQRLIEQVHGLQAG
jgi:hypothetical protein